MKIKIIDFRTFDYFFGCKRSFKTTQLRYSNKKSSNIIENYQAFTASKAANWFVSASGAAEPLKSNIARLPMQKQMKQPEQWVTNEPKSVPTMHCHPGPYVVSNSCNDDTSQISQPEYIQAKVSLAQLHFRPFGKLHQSWFSQILVDIQHEYVSLKVNIKPFCKILWAWGDQFKHDINQNVLNSIHRMMISEVFGTSFNF